jgi:Tfp pilus assembly protein PilF
LTVFAQGLQRQPGEAGKVLLLLALFRVDFLTMEQVLPERALSWLAFAEYLAALRQDVAAESAFRKAVSLATLEDPALKKPYWSFFSYLNSRKQAAEALALILAGIEKFPLDAGFRRQAGSLYERQGIIYRAIEEYQQAILLDPRQAWVKQRLDKLQRKQTAEVN